MIAATLLAVASCSWTNPGHDRFTGTDAAVEDFHDIPAPVRAVLRDRMRRHDFDDIATITNDRIKGAAEYGELRDMHFGANKMCKTVERKWKPDHKEVGIVYCEADHCLIVPTVCGNIAMVTRRRPGGAAGRPEEGVVATSAGGGAPAAVALLPLPSLDNLPPTGAGVPATFAAGSVGNTGGIGSGITASSIPVLGAGQGIGQGGGFIGGGGIVGGGTVPAVPEPATWASLIAGLATIGWFTRRRIRG
jgi:hypothetical protein